jgi:hypothetical protein
MNFEQPPTPETSEKDRRLEELRREVDTIADGLGKGVDEGIKESVVAFMAHELPTSDSCEGHLTEKEEGTVYAPAPEGWKESKEKKAEWKKANDIQRGRMHAMLNEFYATRQTDPEYQLVPQPKGIFGAFILTSAKAESGLSQNDTEELVLEKSRKEMKDFTDFLMQKFEG